eukprot:11166338-Lingulodinium_polyedra.AAC.1
MHTWHEVPLGHPECCVRPSTHARLNNDCNLWTHGSDALDKMEQVVIEAKRDDTWRFKHHRTSCGELTK